MSPLAIYLHIPFCKRKCAYCDFASFAGREAKWNEYFAALSAEIGDWADVLCAYEAHSVFFGGGTPSLVPAEKIAETLAALRRHVVIAPDAEITIEANPGTLSPEKLAAYRAARIDRISIGVQSFDGELLRSLGRIHSPEEAEDAVYMAKAAGFANISIDLMYALPGQNMQSWAETLSRAVALPVQHISAYSLIVEEGTEMFARVEAGSACVPEDDVVNDMQRMAVHRLAAAGFERYEISNYARPGFESRHNLTYWRCGEYLGLGSAAHSMMRNERFANPPELERYLAGERRLNRESRSITDQKEELLMLSTRTTAGLDLKLWQDQFAEDFAEKHAKSLGKLENYGFIEIKDGSLCLTPLGMELQDSVVLELMD